jgi:hypothetical protein
MSASDPSLARSPWQRLTFDDLLQGIRVEHAFAAVPGTGPPLDLRLQIRLDAGPATYSSGVLSALAIPSAGVTWLPGVGLSVQLVAGTTTRNAP